MLLLHVCVCVYVCGSCCRLVRVCLSLLCVVLDVPAFECALRMTFLLFICSLVSFPFLSFPFLSFPLLSLPFLSFLSFLKSANEYVGRLRTDHVAVWCAIGAAATSSSEAWRDNRVKASPTAHKLRGICAAARVLTIAADTPARNGRVS